MSISKSKIEIADDNNGITMLMHTLRTETCNLSVEFRGVDEDDMLGNMIAAMKKLIDELEIDLEVLSY